MLCDKPMAPTSADCRPMIDACAQANRRLMIGYRVPWEPHDVKAERLVRAGELGALRQIVRHTGGREGLQDVRVMEFICGAARTGQPVAVPALR